MMEQLNITRLALCVTLIGLFVSVLVPVFVTSTVEIKNGKFSEVLFDIENQMERMSGIAETSNERIKGLESAILMLKKQLVRFQSYIARKSRCLLIAGADFDAIRHYSYRQA